MLKKFAIALISAILFVPHAHAQQVLLAPVDPLAWAVANTDWGGMGGQSLKDLRAVVNGQVIAHQAAASYTDPQTRIVKRLKCFDPANCIMCSESARAAAKTMRTQLTNSSMASMGNSANLTALATYYDQQAQAAKDRERLNSLPNDYVMTETSIVDGQEVTTTKTVSFKAPTGTGTAQAEQIASQVRQYAANQVQGQGAVVYAYISAAVQTLQKPRAAIELNVGVDPLTQQAASAAAK